MILKSTASKKVESAVPTQKDLKEYSSKLQEELLKSDQSIKLQKAMSKVPA